MQAEVVVLDTNVNRLRQIDFTYRGHLQTVASNAYEIDKACRWADLVIGAVLVPGAKAPKLVSNELVAQMRPGSVLVDIAIDQGGCFADSRPTTHADPTFTVHGSVFYCVANMPGAVPNTSTWALTNVTLPYVVSLADKGMAALDATPRWPRASTSPTARWCSPRWRRRTACRSEVRPDAARRRDHRVPRPPRGRARHRRATRSTGTPATCAATSSTWPRSACRR